MERDNAYGDADVRLLSTVGASMGVALENARLFDETQRRARETAALAEVGRDISSTLDLPTVMDRIARHAMDLTSADNSAIFLPDPGGQTYRAIVAIGNMAEALQSAEIKAGAGIIGNLLLSGRAEFVNDTGSDSRAIQLAGTLKQEHERLMVAPLMAGKVVKGAMAVWRTGGQPFDASGLEFLVGLSLQATVAIENVRLFNETQEALEHQTATAEILQVISGSPTDAQPVFDAIVAQAARLFGTQQQRFVMRAATTASAPPRRRAPVADRTNVPGSSMPGRPGAKSRSAACIERQGHPAAADTASAIDLPERATPRPSGVRSLFVACVPLLRDGASASASSRPCPRNRAGAFGARK